MGKVVVINGVTLDGVMQSPGRAEEDTRGGFTHGGWAQQYADDQVLAVVYARVAEGGGLKLLLGRRSYEELLGYWNTQGGRSRTGSTTPRSTSRHERCESRCPGRIRRCSGEMSPRPSRNSSVT